MEKSKLSLQAQTMSGRCEAARITGRSTPAVAGARTRLAFPFPLDAVGGFEPQVPGNSHLPVPGIAVPFEGETWGEFFQRLWEMFVGTEGGAVTKPCSEKCVAVRPTRSCEMMDGTLGHVSVCSGRQPCVQQETCSKVGTAEQPPDTGLWDEI